VFKEALMDNRDAIIEAATALINEKGDSLEDITVREICGRAGVALGLVNYYFENKGRLVEICVERIVNGIVERFGAIREETVGLAPFDKLERLGDMTLGFLFEHSAVSRISILTDMKSPGEDDNTHRTYRAFLPLVAACRPDWEEGEVRRRTFCLIASMQQAFLRHGEILREQGVDLTEPEARRAFHKRLLRDILEV